MWKFLKKIFRKKKASYDEMAVFRFLFNSRSFSATIDKENKVLRISCDYSNIQAESILREWLNYHNIMLASEEEARKQLTLKTKMEFEQEDGNKNVLHLVPKDRYSMFNML